MLSAKEGRATMQEHDRNGAGRGGRPAGVLLGGAALAGAVAGGTLLLRRFDAWAVQQITQPARRAALGTPADLALAYEEIRLRSEDDVDLYGWLIPAPGGLAQARATLILGHGLGDTIDAILGHVAYLQPAGYNVLLLDFRAHGRSGGAHTSVGYLEHQDVGAGLRYLAGRGLSTIGIMGWSLGAAVAIVSAGLYPQIAGVIADSGFARLASPLARAAASTLGHPPLLARFEGWYGEHLVARTLGFNAADARPAAFIGRISPRPLLIIHSTGDTLVPVANAHALYARAGQPKACWILAAGDHTPGVFAVFPAEYGRRVLAFWDGVFAGRPGGNGR